MNLICRDAVCSVYQMKNETGEGTITSYQIYPGIQVLYNDFHMGAGPSRKFSDTHLIAIHHCSEGRIEQEENDDKFLYLAPGDFMLESSAIINPYCSFPLNHYHGITITISISEVMAEIADLLKMFAIDLSDLEERFQLTSRPFIMRNSADLNHIIAELYHVSESVRTEYLRVKILEMLVMLKTIDPEKAGEERPYFYKTQVDKIKAIMTLITENPDEHYTMEALALQYDISVSALKQCFKGVYGTAIYTYIRNYRMDMAATLLRQTDEPITTIAGKVGYSNSSKFSAAFKSVKGKTPLEYRKVVT